METQSIDAIKHLNFSPAYKKELDIHIQILVKIGELPL